MVVKFLVIPISVIIYIYIYIFVKLLTNSVLDATVIKTIIGNINVLKHVCNNIYTSTFAAATIIVL